MKLLSFDNQFQNSLEQFLEIMYSSRGYRFDPEGLQSDIRDIENVYMKNGGNFWLLMIDNTIVGTIALKVIDTDNRIGEIKRYFVLPTFQNQGFGTMLIGNAMDESRKINLKILRLDTMRKSHKAISIFRRHRFYEIEKYNDNDVAEIYMEVKLEKLNNSL